MGVRTTNDRRTFGLDDHGTLRGGEHLLRALLQAKGDEMFSGLSGSQDPNMLRQLSDSFGQTGQISPAQLAQLLRSGGVPAGLMMPRPNTVRGRNGEGYAGQRSFDFGSANSPLGRFLRDNPFERQQLEMALGGRILPSGEGDDARLSIMPFASGAFPSGGRDNDAAFSASSMLSELDRASSTGGINPYQAGAFQGMVLSALQNMAGSPNQAAVNPQGFSALRAAGNPNPFADWSGDTPNQAQRRNMFGISGGNPVGTDLAPMSNDVGMSSSAMSSYNTLGAGGDDISSMMSSGGLTVEDKVTLMIMMIMKKMDQDIEKQANYINSLQQQQQSGGGAAGGKGGGKGGGAGGGAPSIDVETMKLKRLIDKRSQMFDMLRQIIDKYNQTAKGIIDQMGR